MHYRTAGTGSAVAKIPDTVADPEKGPRSISETNIGKTAELLDIAHITRYKLLDPDGVCAR